MTNYTQKLKAVDMVPGTRPVHPRTREPFILNEKGVQQLRRGICYPRSLTLARKLTLACGSSLETCLSFPICKVGIITVVTRAGLRLN